VAIDYVSIKEAIVTYYSNNISSVTVDGNTYRLRVTKSISEAFAYQDKEVICFVGFDDLQHKEEQSEIGSTTRDVNFRLVVASQAVSEEVADDVVLKILSQLEVYSNSPGSGNPPFGKEEIERTFLLSGDNEANEDYGIAMVCQLHVRIYGT